MTTTPRIRLTAGERHAQLVDAAVFAFAAKGYAGATTEDVARRAGVSQPYVIRVFGTKQALFLAAVDHACDQIEAAFRTAAREDGGLDGLGAAFFGLLGHRQLLLMLLHGFAASDDPAVGPVVRRRFGAVYELVRELTGTDAAGASRFLGTGMLLTVLAAMDAVGPDLTGTEVWAADLLAGLDKAHGPTG